MSKSMGKGVNLSSDSFGALAICALRYCQGRQTYMPSLAQSIVNQHLAKVSDKDLQVMLDDCEMQAKYDLYGDENVDKPGWIRFRQMLEEEQVRRQDGANN